MSHNKSKKIGYTLIEILIGIAIISILSNLIVSIYRWIVRDRVHHGITVQREMNLLGAQNHLRKLIANIGFGEPRVRMASNESLSCEDSNLVNFKNQNKTIGLAQNCNISGVPIHDRLYFRSLYAPRTNMAGCWWLKDADGTLISMSIDKTAKMCDFPNDPNKRCIIMPLDKSSFREGPCSNLNNAEIAYYKGGPDEDTAEVFRIHLSSPDDLNDERQRRFYYRVCAPRTGILRLQRESNLSSDNLLDCVGGLKFQFVGMTSEGMPKAIRMCLLVQVSGRQTTRQPVLLNSQCGSFSQGDLSWEFYRWRVIEEVIALENLK